MRIAIPVYIESRKSTAVRSTRHIVRPLFFPHPQQVDESLGRAMSRFVQQLTAELNRLGSNADHGDLAAYTYCPTVEQQRFDLVLELRRQTPRGRYFFAVFRALGRKVAFCPNLPDLWFELKRGEELKARATEVLTEHFRREEHEQGDEFEFPEHVPLNGSAWITTTEIELHPSQELPSPKKFLQAFLGGPDKMDGRVELQRVGRCLNWLYPDELDRVLARDREVAELTRLLQAEDKRPILLVGPRLVGKTAVIHEHVWQVTKGRRTAYGEKQNLWLLSPQRLVSGMAYVGQWENRLLAILDAAKKSQSVLYFDDFLGLFHAGISRESDLSMGQVLKPYVERRDCRFLAEMTPEQLRVFRERDRGLADQFHLLPIAEPTPDENLRIQFSILNGLEDRHKCLFALDALPAVLQLQRRYARDVAFPGKAARFVQRLAVRAKPKTLLSRQAVLQEFQRQSGLSLQFLDEQVTLERKEVLQELSRRVIGQPTALEAVADILCIAKARLNDPDRPLGSLLFLGPTGVGKTQCAKAVAEYLFGNAERLVRIDMNEYVAPGSATRLVGTFDQPDGQLTSTVRRQPFSVVLFDEIEKAHPDVFDVLLQVLGEGRLTNALGQTVDFANTIIVLTSNLGVKAAASRVGFAGDQPDPQVFVKAAEAFFRPEFFNRLDRIIPFGQLGREEIRSIARLAIQEVFGREGLARRKCLLQVDEATLDHVAEKAFSPTLGARALKRGIERQITQPAANRLAALQPDAITIVHLFQVPTGLAVDVQPLVDADPLPDSLAMLDLRDPAAVFERVQRSLQRIEADIQALRPTGPISASALTAAQLRYYLLRDAFDALQERCKSHAVLLKQRGPNHGYQPPKSGGPITKWIGDGPSRGSISRELAAAQDIREYLQEMSEHAPVAQGTAESSLQQILQQLVVLHAICVAPATRERGAPTADEEGGASHPSAPGAPQRAELTNSQCLLIIRPSSPADAPLAETLAAGYLSALGDALSLESERISNPPNGVRLVIVRGPHAWSIVAHEAGTHLATGRMSPAFSPLQVEVLPLADGESPLQQFQQREHQREAWLRDLAQGATVFGHDNPHRHGPVVRVYEAGGQVVDVRTGQCAPMPLAPDRQAAFLLSAAALPEEFKG